jgi:hypothetical protein
LVVNRPGSDVTPGKYWIKAIWDKAAPFAEADASIPAPGKGDFETVGRPMIEIRAGKTIRDLEFDCLTEVAAP